MNCPNCSQVLNENDVFCFSCGCCTQPEKFENKEAVKLQEGELKKIINAVKGTKHISVNWNETVDRYVKVAEQLDCLCDNSENTEHIRKIKKRLGAFIDRCQSPEFHIAFVGTIKAGKSTLINALLGKNLASTSVTPETAVLTKFRYDDKGYIKVRFYNKDQWEQLWTSVSKNADIFMKEYNALNRDAEKEKWISHTDIEMRVTDSELEEEIEKWTSSKHVEHYFVREVEIGLPGFPYRQNVVFVDTPGLDDAVAYRSNVTREYIDRANAVFACVKSDALTGQELNILYRVFANTSYNTDKVYVIGTQWDSLNNPETDWNQQKKECIKYLTRESCYSSEAAASRNIIHAAAYVMNLCREYEHLSKEESRPLKSIAFKFDIMPDEISENLPVLMEKSNISAIHSKIEQDIIGKTQQYLLGDITQTYKDICSEIRDYYSDIKYSQEDIIRTSGEEVDVIRAKYEEEKDKLEEIKDYQQQLTDTLALVREDTARRVNELCKTIKGMVN